MYGDLGIAQRGKCRNRMKHHLWAIYKVVATAPPVDIQVSEDELREWATIGARKQPAQLSRCALWPNEDGGVMRGTFGEGGIVRHREPKIGHCAV